ncbi:hypothetical protein HPB52_002969 [Rhipicephalus sanguineus]|uniref:Uncharacterized protein n=1 Tax=Rhipicephalus sanguineus TaxID=34632 RepID=A0A9D4Q4D6_RHISA|nr:hypothetical protein HPB52_002969 [Rhipicephalus sanguineus]
MTANLIITADTAYDVILSVAAVTYGSFTGVNQNQDSATVSPQPDKAATAKGATFLEKWFDANAKFRPEDLDNYAVQTDAEADRFAQVEKVKVSGASILEGGPSWGSIVGIMAAVLIGGLVLTGAVLMPKMSLRHSAAAAAAAATELEAGGSGESADGAEEPKTVEKTAEATEPATSHEALAKK